MPAVERRYREFVQSSWGELDIPRLCEVMWNAGGRAALDASREFSDIGPTLSGIDQRVHRLLEMWRRMAADDEQQRAYEWAMSNAMAEEHAIIGPPDDEQEALPF
jgi:hypothetical protein